MEIIFPPKLSHCKGQIPPLKGNYLSDYANYLFCLIIPPKSPDTGDFKAPSFRLVDLFSVRSNKVRQMGDLGGSDKESSKSLNCLFFLLFFIFTASACLAQKEAYIFTSFHEPAAEGLRLLYSYDGYKWTGLDSIFLKPEVGTQKVMRDPSITQGPDGTFHLVWTSSWKGDLGFGYANSRDLIHWSAQKHLEVMAYDTSTVNVWAPEVFYDDESKQFIIVWASTIPYKFSRGIEDERNNHRLYYITTKDFNTCSETKLFLDPGFSVIDAVIMKREKGNYVLVLKDNTRPMRNIKVAFGKSALGPYTDISQPITPSFTEGPTVVKVGSKWLIYFDSYKEKTYNAIETGDFKTFTDISNVIKVPEGHKHGTICKVPENIINGLTKHRGSQSQK